MCIHSSIRCSIQIHFVTNKQDTISTGKPVLKGDHICLRCPTPRTPSPSTSPFPPTPASVRYPCPVKKVKIESTTQKALQFSEVQALSYPDANNVALQSLQATATQSSTYNNKQQFAAYKAIDGSISTFSQTNEEVGSWWQVVLNEETDLSAVNVLNRYCGSSSDLKGCLCLLSFARLSLYSNDDVIATRTFGNTCGQLAVLEEFMSCPRPTQRDVDPPPPIQCASGLFCLAASDCTPNGFAQCVDTCCTNTGSKTGKDAKMRGTLG